MDSPQSNPTKTFKVVKHGVERWVVVRQLPHDPRYTVGSRISGIVTVVLSGGAQ